MDKEISKTIELWARWIQEGAKGSAGNGLIDVISSLSREKVTVSESQLKVFRYELAKRLFDMCEQVWDESNPKRGEYYRSLYNDYSPWTALAEALDAAGIDHRLLPIKTGTITNPGSVWYNIGYGAQLIEIKVT